MSGFMLDTDTVSFALRGEGQVAERLLSHPRSKLFVSSLTLAELRFGAEKRCSRGLHARIDTLTASITVLPFDSDAADEYGTIAAALANQGTPIGQMDTLIGAHALSARLTLVTNNTKHFARVSRLKTENWC